MGLLEGLEMRLSRISKYENPLPKALVYFQIAYAFFPGLRRRGPVGFGLLRYINGTNCPPPLYAKWNSADGRKQYWKTEMECV